MKRSRLTLAPIVAWPNLMAAFGRAASGKRGRGDVEAFRSNLDRNLERISADLLEGRYVPEPMRAFSIRDPKPRMIHAPAFRDRVVHHAIMAHASAVLERGLISDTYACRAGKGGHRAVWRAAELSKRGRWYCHADIAQYFPSIDHSHLKSLLRRSFSDHNLLALFDNIIDSHGQGMGLPIGALTSQNFANAFLGPIDRLISEHKSSTGYLRYMDDMLWWCQNRQDCEQVLQSVTARAIGLGLTLKSPPKIARTTNGMTFCGFRVAPGQVLLSKRRRRRFRLQFDEAENDYAAGNLGSLELQRKMDAVLATTRHAECGNWRKIVVANSQVARGYLDA